MLAEVQSDPNQQSSAPAQSVCVSIGILAWNEEDAIAEILRALSTQTIFAELAARGLGCELLVVANGCTDGTCAVAEQALRKYFGVLTEGRTARWKVVDLAARGKLNAWNQFIHTHSSPEAQFFFLLDADIAFDQSHTLASMLSALQENREAAVSVDVPRKQFGQKPGAAAEALSNSAAALTAAAPAQLCAQLYCIRSEIARNIWLPRDLAACDDGFIKALVCTDSLTRPLDPRRICVAPNASHRFEAYTRPGAVLRNQKRQVIGQTIVHILIDQHLPSLAYPQRLKLGETIRHLESSDPDWLKRLIAAHVADARYPWRLYPNLLTHRFAHFRRLSLGKKMLCIPGLVAGMGATLAASWLAFRALKRGCTDYWPKAGRGKGKQPSADFRNSKLNTHNI